MHWRKDLPLKVGPLCPNVAFLLLAVFCGSGLGTRVRCHWSRFCNTIISFRGTNLCSLSRIRSPPTSDTPPGRPPEQVTGVYEFLSSQTVSDVEPTHRVALITHGTCLRFGWTDTNEVCIHNTFVLSKDLANFAGNNLDIRVSPDEGSRVTRRQHYPHCRHPRQDLVEVVLSNLCQIHRGTMFWQKNPTLLIRRVQPNTPVE